MRRQSITKFIRTNCQTDVNITKSYVLSDRSGDSEESGVTTTTSFWVFIPDVSECVT